jgi:hypothetical protein
VTQDITFRYNRVRNVASAFNLADRYNASLARMRRVTIAHNVITGLDGQPPARLFLVQGRIEGLNISNNSAIGGYYDLVATEYGSEGNPDMVFRNNVTGAPYSIYTSWGAGQVLINQLRMPQSSFAGNVVAAGQGPSAVPSGNTFAPSAAAIGFVDLAGGNFELSSTSPYRASGVGGTTPGVNFASLNAATAGVVR